MKLRIATRRSALALAQTRAVARDIEARAPGIEIEEVLLVTEGDRVLDRSLAEVGGKGLFVKELEAALIEGKADLAVHSLKDLPADMAPGLTLAAVPPRESPWDLLVTRDGRALHDLPQGARVGTSSLRREIQLRAVRPDLVIAPLRGNVDTRLRKLEQGHFDAIVVAEAAIRRLGVTVNAQRLEGILVPAIGQGALALQIRADDARTAALVVPLEDPDTRTAITAERTVMRVLGGSCTVPMGALAWCISNRIEMVGFYGSEDGSRWSRAHTSGPAHDPEAVGCTLAEVLREGLHGTSVQP